MTPGSDRDHVIVHLCLNVSSSAYNGGRVHVVDGSNAMAAI